MQIRLVALELARAYLTEGYAGTVVRVDVGGNLEDEASELCLVGAHHALLCLGRTWRWGYLYEAVEELLHTEVVEGRTEEYRCHLGSAVCLDVKLWIYAADEFEVVTQLLCIVSAHLFVEGVR